MDTTYRLGRWTFHPDRCRLDAADAQRVLEERSARTLEMLCRRRGEVVGKDELIAAIWQGRTVSPNSLAIVIGDLRRALDDDPRAPTLILTVNKRGYRLAEAAADTPLKRWRRPSILVSSGAVLLALALLVAATLRAPVALVVEPTRNDTGKVEYAPLTASLSTVVVDSAAHLRGFSVARRPGSGKALVLRTRLILWGGAPELAITAVDPVTGAVVWSGFAQGPDALLARHSAGRLREMGMKLKRRSFL